MLKKILPGIVCWGDSLTVGASGDGATYPNVLESLIKKNISYIPVINMGVGGETTNTIIGRAGAEPFVADSFTIPRDTSEVKITLRSSNGSDVAPLKQGDNGVNPVEISGIKGNIKIVQEDYASPEQEYYFSRLECGNSILVENNTEVITDATGKYKDFINIIFIGQNGGWNNIDSLINQQKSIINKLERNKEKYLILGLTSGSASDRVALEKAMVKEYGDKYINLREYLSTNGMNDAGLIKTKEDIKFMEQGMVPPSLLVDEVHFNKEGYTLIGKYIYNRMIELGYFVEIEEYLE